MDIELDTLEQDGVQEKHHLQTMPVFSYFGGSPWHRLGSALDSAAEGCCCQPCIGTELGRFSGMSMYYILHVTVFEVLSLSTTLNSEHWQLLH